MTWFEKDANQEPPINPSSPDSAMAAPQEPPSSPFSPDDESPPDSLDRSLALVRYLRRHCPWDEAQTPRSLIPHLLEEAHEVVDAVRAGDQPELEGELGDLLLNLAFQIVLGDEQGHFTGASVMRRLEHKMVRRHPHLFSDVEREDWEVLKARERTEGQSALSGLASGLDPLLKAYRIQDRAAGVGFDWPDPSGALAKVREELDEVAEAQTGEGPVVDRSGTGSPQPSDRVREEVGDLLFAVVNLARLSGVHPDAALDDANRKFQRRFERLEAMARERGIPLPGADLDALDALWDELKAAERID